MYVYTHECLVSIVDSRLYPSKYRRFVASWTRNIFGEVTQEVDEFDQAVSKFENDLFF